MIALPWQQMALRLREIKRTDARDLYRWRMDPLTRQQFRNTRTVPFKSHRAYIERYFRPENSDHWLIIELAGKPIGSIALYNFSSDRTEAEWGRFVIAPEHRRQGHGGRALELLMEYAFKTGVRRLRCDVLASNAAAVALYHRFGFLENGSYEHRGRRFLQLGLDLGGHS